MSWLQPYSDQLVNGDLQGDTLNQIHDIFSLLAEAMIILEKVDIEKRYIQRYEQCDEVMDSPNYDHEAHKKNLINHKNCLSRLETEFEQLKVMIEMHINEPITVESLRLMYWVYNFRVARQKHHKNQRIFSPPAWFVSLPSKLSP